ncbi:MAG TPA: tetratricopeptide repeat protein [Polyangia bacterium]|nr:tetratricopeptide repeat protein [Polyangia bacterium]
MSDELTRRRALVLWQEAQNLHLAGQIERAIELYTRSLAVCPTAEAYTFRGWAYSFQGRIEEAIEECKRAIETDPSFGNPYNDIGSYLMAQGKLEDAVPWLERAKTAERYEPRHFPYMNLGRIFAARGLIGRAIAEFEGALALHPGEPFCLAALRELKKSLN